MRIIKVYKKVGTKFKALVDLETDVTKYSDEYQNVGSISYADRFKSGFFDLEFLQHAKNYDLFHKDLAEIDFNWSLERIKSKLYFNFKHNLKQVKTATSLLFKERC